MIRHLLIVCEDPTDPAGLLAVEEPSGRPPMVREWEPGRWSANPPTGASWRIREQGAPYGPRALPLVWRGAPCGEQAVARVLAVLARAVGLWASRGVVFNARVVAGSAEVRLHGYFGSPSTLRAPPHSVPDTGRDRLLLDLWALATVFCDRVPGYRVEVVP